MILRNLLRSTGLTFPTFASAYKFLASRRPAGRSCLVLGVQIPGLSGLEPQQELAKGHAPLPIILITGHGDIPVTVRASETRSQRRPDEIVPRRGPAHRRHAGAAPQPPDTHPPAAVTPDAADDRRTDSRFAEIVGQSAALRRVPQQLDLVAPTDATVLVDGETGTGQELIARALHQLSARRTHALVTLNCAAIPPDLLESDLFGHEKAPSQARSRNAWGALNCPTGDALPGRNRQPPPGAARPHVRASGILALAAHEGPSGSVDAPRSAGDGPAGRDRETRLERAETDALRHRFESLTPREREVLELIAAGLLNKQPDGDLESPSPHQSTPGKHYAQDAGTIACRTGAHGRSPQILEFRWQVNFSQSRTDLS